MAALILLIELVELEKCAKSRSIDLQFILATVIVHFIFVPF